MTLMNMLAFLGVFLPVWFLVKLKVNLWKNFWTRKAS